jgi:hypothetical protein
MSVPIHKIALRRSLISFSSTLVGLIAFIGIMSLFSIWSMNRAHIGTEQEIEKIRDLADEGLLAQIDFKVQVQEWKNILLRGSDQTARAKYMAAFENREAEMEKHLSNLATQADNFKLFEFKNRATTLIEQHRQLAGIYRQALASTPDLMINNVQSIDKMVLGIDRVLEDDISKLSQEISEFSKLQRNVLLQSLFDRYKTLRSVLLAIISFSLVITGISLYGTLRVTRD